MRTFIFALVAFCACTRIERTLETAATTCDTDAHEVDDTSPADAGTPRTLIAILGQSNAVGLGQPKRLTDQTFAQPYPAVTFEATTAANTIAPIQWETYPRGDLAPYVYQTAPHFGVELTMGRDLDAAQPGAWAVVKFAVNGTTLANKWSPTGTTPAPGNGNLAHLALAAVQTAQQACACERVVFVWIQGEADAASSSQAASYATNLAGLVAFYRLSFPDAPWVIGRLNADFAHATSGAYTAAVRAAQEQFVASDAHAALVDMDSVLPDPSNHTHYFADGYAELGHLYAQALVGL